MRAGAVAQFELEVEVAVAVGPQLLVDDQKHLLDGVAVRHLLHETPRHVRRPRREESDEGCPRFA